MKIEKNIILSSKLFEKGHYEKLHFTLKNPIIFISKSPAFFKAIFGKLNIYIIHQKLMKSITHRMLLNLK